MLPERRKKIIEFIAVFLFFYLATVLFLFFKQRSFIYFPNPQEQSLSVYGAEDMAIIKVETEDGLTLSGWYKPPAHGKPVIVVFHGNASHMGMSAWKVRPYMDAGYGALLPAYRGYAGNPGKPTEKGLYKDAKAFLKWLIDEQNIPESQVVLLGESLGSGPAVEMAAFHFRDIGALILESPYTSFADLAKRQYFFVPFVGALVRDRFDNLDKIGEVRAPLLIIHGRNDLVVPFQCAEKLYEAANQPKELVAVALAGHNNLYVNGAAMRVLHFLSGLENI